MVKYPKTLGACVDLLFKQRNARLAAQKKVDAQKAEESALSDYILNTFQKAELEGAKGKLASASLAHSTVAQVDDWEKLYKYIEENKAFDMLQRRVNDGAYRARLEENLVVPGVTPFVTTKLSLNKR